MINSWLVIHPTPESRTSYPDQRVSIFDFRYQRSSRISEACVLIPILMAGTNHLPEQLHVYVLALVPTNALLRVNYWHGGTPQDICAGVSNIGISLSPACYNSMPAR